MPRTARSLECKLEEFVRRFGIDTFSHSGKNLYCKVCGITVNSKKSFGIEQHIKSAKHKRLSDGLLSGNRQVSQLQAPNNDFNYELCKALVEANIPLYKLENVSLQNFLKKYMQREIPSESHLRKNYVDLCYKGILQDIRTALESQNIWISIDETTDVRGRYIANVIVGSMDSEKGSNVYLLASMELARANNTTISQSVTSALALLWPEGIKYDNVLLFVTDAAPYMKKAAGILKVLFPKMIHLTCVAHAIHRISEFIRGLFPDIDSLISNGKKVFLKAPARCDLFKETLPNATLPPQPVITRWGTWISAGLYYADHLDGFTEVLNKLNFDEAVSIRDAKNVLGKSSLRTELAFFRAHFSNIPKTIESLEKKNNLLITALATFTETIEQLCTIPGENGTLVRNKCKKVMDANKGLEKITAIARILKGDKDVTMPAISPQELACFKYAPVTSVDVERSFSSYKRILSDRDMDLNLKTWQKC